MLWYSMPPYSSTQVYRLYRQDKLIVHSIPLDKREQRSEQLKCDSSLACGTLLFCGGLTCRKEGQCSNAVARFGGRERVRKIVFSTLHDLDLVWQTHARLEASKPPDKRGKPFVYFTSRDMADMANLTGQPAEHYCDCHFQLTPPVQAQRTQSFNFRSHCELHGQEQVDTQDQGTYGEWNEIRACLNTDNMVGLCYVHDPAHDPRQYMHEAEELHKHFNEDYEMFVFQVDRPDGVNGDLLVQEWHNNGEVVGCAVTFRDFVQDARSQLKQL